MIRSQKEMECLETVSEFPRSIEQVEAKRKIIIRVRFDYKGTPRPARFFFGGKGSREAAEELRQREAAMWRNVPIQGVRIEDIQYFELYTVFDQNEEDFITYAPMEVRANVDTLEDCLRFVIREEFRCVELIEPAQVTLSSVDLERIFFKFSEKLQLKLNEQELK
jgi:hypothetical protein